MYVLGINASHNGSACLTRNGKIIVAVQEERIAREKGRRIYGSEPSSCISYCLDNAGIEAKDLDLIVVCPQKGSQRVVHDPYLNPVLRPQYYGTECMFVSHHLAHAVGVFATSGFKESAILIVDGVGSTVNDMLKVESATALRPIKNGQEIISIYSATNTSIYPIEKQLTVFDSWLDRKAWDTATCKKMPSFNSLGGMYASAATQIFGNMDDGGKVMGLAPYGKPIYGINEFFSIDRNSFKFSNSICNYFQTNSRWPVHRKKYEDLAASVQLALEEAMFFLTERTQKLVNSRNLCLAGGVALNSVCNQKILERYNFENTFIMPSSDDSGIAIGASMYGFWKLTGTNLFERLNSDSLGISYSQKKIQRAVQVIPGLSEEKNIKTSQIVDELCKGKIMGWFQGGSEFGPRALGFRSIVCDPRLENGKEILNSTIKFRESFRPFAPVILEEEASNWFHLSNTSVSSPFMLRVARWKEEVRDLIPAVVHCDGTGRFQTICKTNNPPLYKLLKAFHEKTGVPILVNTSFNIMGEPIVETPEHAIWSFLYSGLDGLVLGSSLISKESSFRSILDFTPVLSEFVIYTNSFLGAKRIKNGITSIYVSIFDNLNRERKIRITELEKTILENIGIYKNGWQLAHGIRRSFESDIEIEQIKRGLFRLYSVGIITVESEK